MPVSKPRNGGMRRQNPFEQARIPVKQRHDPSGGANGHATAARKRDPGAFD
jgi:hypothetical protein